MLLLLLSQKTNATRLQGTKQLLGLGFCVLLSLYRVHSGTNMVVDRKGFRLNVGLILVNDEGQVFWGKRIGHDAWQFPQGGVNDNETAKQALFRELQEEVGLEAEDIEILAVTKHWLRYRLPKQYIRKRGEHTVIGQKQKWFLCRLAKPDQKIQLDLSLSPEFDSWRWVDYFYPAEEVIFFKRQVYRIALRELERFLPKNNAIITSQSPPEQPD